ncbi:MAG: radical SAM protein [Rhodospirillaceae bacterium]|nr:radical SAM protein [Rhodospirillaceae bacterium]
MTGQLFERIAYKHKYFETPEALLEQVINKTVVPYQVELQPGRLTGRKICWMECPYCYGASSENVSDRLTPERYIDIMRQMTDGPHGGVAKIIFAGYATDPLNYEHIDDLVEISRHHGQITGFHSKLLRASDRLIDLLTRQDAAATSYMTVSVDAGSSESYNTTHGVKISGDVYHRVIENLKRICQLRDQRRSHLDMAANYLLTRVNSDTKTVEQGLRDIIDTGVDVIRFSFPQLPRGSESVDGTVIPNRAEIEEIYQRLKPVIDDHTSDKTNVVLLDVDGESAFTERRTLPCFARFIYPAISYDGYLSNCSQSGAPHFRDMSLGNLQEVDFWDAFYNYDTEDIWLTYELQHTKITKNDCRCDRKEHTVNRIFQNAFGNKPHA